MPSQGIGARLRTRLYLEGRLIENALVTASMTATPGQPASCELELVPTNTIRHILPGTWVHLFVTDPWDPEPAGDLSDFKLLFEGIVTTRGFSRTDESRNFRILCQDPSVYWTSARQQWLDINTAHGNFMDQIAHATSGGLGKFGILGSKPSFGYMGAELKKIEDDKSEIFLDTLIGLIDDLGNVNPFYTNARNRFRLTDRILRGPAGDSAKLFQMTLMSEFVNGLAGQVSGQSNLSQIVNLLLSVIMHEWVPVLAPPYIEAKIFERDAFGNLKREEQTKSEKSKRDRNKKPVYRYRMAKDHIIASMMFKPHIYTISPPTFNTLFPNMYDQGSYSENFISQPTRTSMTPNIPILGPEFSQMIKLLRPTEIETFVALTRDPERRTAFARTPDGKFADGVSQASTFSDFDWSTNEERIRGIVYDYMNLPPSPSTLTMANQGTKGSTGERKGGVPKYLNNVVSYEHYRSKFAARTASVRGPFNMRPVVGFPMAVLDDSSAKLNIIGYLQQIQHHIQADGNATTTYAIAYPRIANEVDYNSPKFDVAFDKENRLRLDLFRDEEGNYNFEELFREKHAPPIPEWFDESFRNVVDLNSTYKEWFGEEAGVIQTAFNTFPRNRQIDSDTQGVLEEVLEVPIDPTTVGRAKAGLDDTDQQTFEEVLATAENISVEDAIDELNKLFLADRTNGKEFERAAVFTKRSFTKIDEAFSFVGASSEELADPSTEESQTTLRNRARPKSFSKDPVSSRSINYKNVKLEVFVGDPSSGSGYSAVPLEGDGGDTMTGAFPVFDTEIHTGAQATHAPTRKALQEDPAQRSNSQWPRYDGRPLMFDFEYRLWLQSRFNAKQTPTGEELAENAAIADYFVLFGDSVVRQKSPIERAESTAKRRSALASRDKRERDKSKRGRVSSRKDQYTHTPSAEQAPTGDGLEQSQKLPLTQPLAESQVVELRRAIVVAYRDELARNRGFTG